MAFYSEQYSRFASPLAAAVRQLVYGEDIGQQGWRSLDEQDAIVQLVSDYSPCDVLDVACGSGGPSLALVQRTGCRLMGVDAEPAAIRWALRRTAELGLVGKAEFAEFDCNRVLPFGDGAFDLTICIDAVIHLADRVAAVADWARVLRKSGRLLFTDAAVLTGAVSKEEIDKRASQGAFTIARPGANENAIASAGLILLRREDKTEATANVASRWFDVRERFAVDLKNEEGEEFFARRQIFLATTAELAASRRLSRFLYVAEKRA